MRRPFRFTTGALALLILVGTVVTHAGEPLALDDVTRLVEAGVGTSVIRYKVEIAGLAFEMDVDAILRLREAGADDILTRFLIGHAEESAGAAAMVPDAATVTAATGSSTATATADGAGIRLIRQTGPSGRQTVVLTNVGSAGRQLRDGGPVRGIISSAARPPVPGHADAARMEPAGFAVEGEAQARVDDLEDRVAESLEDEQLPADEWAEGPDEIENDFPEHPVNDLEDHPLVDPWGYPVYFPFAFEPTPFKKDIYGPFMSYTSAFQGRVNPFEPLPPCEPGVACTVAQRLAHPNP